MPSRPVGDVLRDLLRIRRLSEFQLEVEMPLTTFHLQSGRDLSGWIIDIDLNGKEKTVLIQLSGNNSSSPSLDACLIPWSSIEAISIHQVSEIAHLISQGRIGSPIERSSLSKSEIKQKFSEFTSFFETELELKFDLDADWEKISDESIETLSLMDLIRDTLIACYEFNLKDANRTHFTKKIRQIFFKSGTRVQVVLKAGKLLVSSPLKQNRKGWNAPNEISLLIRKALK